MKFWWRCLNVTDGSDLCVARPGLLTIRISMSSAQFLAHCDRTSVQLFSSSVSDSPQNIFWIFWPGAVWDGSRASSSNQHTKREVVFRVTKLTSWSQISFWQSSWCFWGLFGSCCSFWHVDDHLQCIVVFPVSCFLCVCSVFVCCCCVQYNLIKRFYRTFSDPFVFLQQDSDEKRRKDLADKTRVCFIRPQPDFIISRRLLRDVLDGFVKVRRRPQLDGKISLKEQSDIFNKTVSLFIFTRSRGDDISFIWSAFSLA